MNQAVYLGPYGRSTKGLAINALLVQLYQPELLTTGPAAKMPRRGFLRWQCRLNRRREAPGPRVDWQGLPIVLGRC